MAAYFPYFKALHIVFATTWFAGLFCVMQLLLHQQRASAPSKLGLPTELMSRLWRFVIWPSALLTLLFGGAIMHPWLQQSWFHIKGGLILLLVAVHLLCYKKYRASQKANGQRIGGLRALSEGLNLLLFAIVGIAVLRDERLLWLFLWIIALVVGGTSRCARTANVQKQSPITCMEPSHFWKNTLTTGCVLLFLALCLRCAPGRKQQKLPILGPKGSDGTMENHHRVAAFSFINQDSLQVTQDTFADKIYVADFFFTSCPTICPIMKAQMLRVYKKYEDWEEVLLLSHTIDPMDEVSVLRAFAHSLGVRSDKWHFVTGAQKAIRTHATESYMTAVEEDKKAPGGFLHAGYFLLVDGKRRIRGVYDGTSEEDVTRLLHEMDVLLAERRRP